MTPGAIVVVGIVGIAAAALLRAWWEEHCWQQDQKRALAKLERARRKEAADPFGVDAELEELARLFGEMWPTAKDIQELRFFNIDDWMTTA